MTKFLTWCKHKNMWRVNYKLIFLRSKTFTILNYIIGIIGIANGTQKNVQQNQNWSKTKHIYIDDVQSHNNPGFMQ